MSRPPLRRTPAVGRALEKIIATARAHTMFPPGSRVLVAVSGGADSLCLLHSLVRLRRLFRIDPVCFHFDHRLRPGSEADAAYVRRQAIRLEVPFVVRRAIAGPGRGESVEAWARTVRYQAIRTVLEELGGGVAAVGHTADDQAETVLLAMLRGGGLEALGGMQPVSLPIVRPLLDLTREETQGFCRSLGLRPRHDPMNEDPSYMRAAIRTQVIPELERALGRNVRSTLVRTALLLRRDAELLERLADEETARVVRRDGNAALLSAAALRDLPAALAGRVIRRVLLNLGELPEAGHVEAVRGLAGARAGARISLPGGLLGRREKEYVRLSRPSPGPIR